MELHLKKNKSAEIMIPMVDSSSPASLKSGLTVTDIAYYKDGAGAWTSLAITDTFTEIDSTGMYTIEMTAGELNHDLIMIKCTASGAADSVMILRTFDVDIEDLVRSTTPANTLDISATGEAGLDFSNINGTHPTVATVTSVTNDVGITQVGADKVWGSANRTLTSFGTLVSDIWDALTSGLTTVGSIGKLLVDNINATISSRSSHSAADVWTSGTRTLTAGTKDTEIDAIKAKTDNLPADTATLLNRIVGLEKENYYLDNTSYSNGQLTSGRIRIYSDAASVGSGNNVIATYQVTGVYSSGQLTSYKVVKQ